MFENYMFTIIYNHVDASVEEIEKFVQVADELNISDIRRAEAFSLYHLDPTTKKLVFNTMIKKLSTFGCSYMMVTAKVIVNNKLLLKAMGGDLPGDTIPDIISKMAEQYKNMSFTNKPDWDAFINGPMARDILAGVVKKISDNKEKARWTESEEEAFYKNIVQLLCNDAIDDGKIRLFLDTTFR